MAYNKDFWNQRYQSGTYLYGQEANAFLQEQCQRICGPVLSLAEGEGRNAVFLASLGLDVVGVDQSEVALQKAQRLAQQKGVQITTAVADLAVYQPPANSYNAVISIFAHLPSNVRAQLYPRIETTLKPGGLLLLEGYALAQLQRNTGGPKDPDMLPSTEQIRREFAGLTPLLLQTVERDVSEGTGHTGLAHVVQFVGQKPPV